MAPQIQQQCNLVKKCSLSTVKNRLKEFNLQGSISRHKPMISVKNRKRSLNFVRCNKDHDISYWSKVLFWNESKFNQLGSDGRQYVRRRKDEEFNPRCSFTAARWWRFSYGVGVISANGPGPIVCLQGQINSTKYINMLTEHFLPYFGRNLVDNSIFMQNNAPIHTAGRLNCRKRAFFDKITLLLDLGSHFKSVSEATDLDLGAS